MTDAGVSSAVCFALCKFTLCNFEVQIFEIYTLHFDNMSMFNCTLKILSLRFALFGISLVLGIVLVLASPGFLVNIFPVKMVNSLIRTLGMLYDELGDYELICRR